MLPEEEDRKRQGYLVGKVYPHKNLNPADYIYLLRHHIRTDGSHLDAADRSSTTNIPEVSEILQRLKEDLKSSKSFVEDFVNDTNRGIRWLLDFLRLCPDRRDKTHVPKDRQYSLKRSLTEEYDCLHCLKLTSGSARAIDEIVEHTDGLATIANSIMSSYSKSRVVALELLTKCSASGSRGYEKVLEAMSQLRIIYGESVRFKFLVAMLNGNGTTPPGFERVTLSFLNTLLRKCPKLAERIRLQCELEEAGLDMRAVEIKMHAKNVANDDDVWQEIKKWKEICVDVDNDLGQRRHLTTENVKLQQEVILLRKALKKLEDDKISLMQIERELKDKCADLDQEVNNLRKELKETKSSLIISKSEESDSSDAIATDSGRHSSLTNDYFLSEENDQADSEEILIDIPTIRPPIGFRSGADEYTSDRDDKKSKGNGSRRDDDSALSESDSDSAITWQYPALVTETRSRSAERSAKSPNHRTPRSRSENRREKAKGAVTSVEDAYSSGFFFRPASSHTSGHVSTDSFTSLPPELPVEMKGRPNKSTKSFPLPVAYRRHFVLRGHSNCGKYSGVEKKDVKIPAPDYVDHKGEEDGVSLLVHREITEAVRQIGGWL